MPIPQTVYTHNPLNNLTRTCLGTTFVIIGSLRLDETSEELSYTIPSMFIWANVEVNFGVVAGQCLLDPVFSTCADMGVSSLRTSTTAVVFDVQNGFMG